MLSFTHQNPLQIRIVKMTIDYIYWPKEKNESDLKELWSWFFWMLVLREYFSWTSLGKFCGKWWLFMNEVCWTQTIYVMGVLINLFLTLGIKISFFLIYSRMHRLIKEYFNKRMKENTCCPDLTTKLRDFKCPCGKAYLSYPALFTHIKQKHNGKV